MLSRICEEFSCLPSEAAWELDNDPERMVLRVLPLRSLANGKAICDNPEIKESDRPADPMVQLASDIEFDVFRGHEKGLKGEKLVEFIVDRQQTEEE